MGKMLVAKESFVMDIDGTSYTVERGRTRVDETHTLVQRSPSEWWEEVGETYPVEQATAAPGERRAAAKKSTTKVEEGE